MMTEENFDSIIKGVSQTTSAVVSITDQNKDIFAEDEVKFARKTRFEPIKYVTEQNKDSLREKRG